MTLDQVRLSRFLALGLTYVSANTLGLHPLASRHTRDRPIAS